jgi:hypothetical protein
MLQVRHFNALTHLMLMNDAVLTEQLRKTGNLMDLLNGEAWVREANTDHASEEGTVEAGLGLQPYVELLYPC